MNDLFSIKLEKDGDIPLYQQLGDKIAQLIEQGILSPGHKLPPIRKLAESLGVNNVTIVGAYKYLENKKIVYSQVGSGTYVSEIKLTELPEPILKNQFQMNDPVAFDIKDAINFAKSSPNPNLFPVDEFKVLFNNVLERDRGYAFSYQDSQGYPPLREAICNYLGQYNIRTTSDKIQIISGAQQGIDILSKVLLSAGDIVFVEKPTFYGAVGAFLSRNAQVVEIDLENDGMDLEKLESLLKVYRPKFIYVMSYYQTPTCISYSLEKKHKLLNLAQKYNTYIIEEDNQSEFTFTEEKVVPLKALDYKNRVMYVKSFSKILMPGLRLGFMVLPKKILQSVMNAKYTTDISTSGFIQRAFELYLGSSDWNRHIRTMSRIYQKRYETAIKAVDTFLLDYVHYKKPVGGVNLWLTFKKETDIKGLCDALISNNVIVTPGDVFSINKENMNSIRLSFADVDNRDIVIGIQKISEILKKGF